MTNDAKENVTPPLILRLIWQVNRLQNRLRRWSIEEEYEGPSSNSTSLSDVSSYQEICKLAVKEESIFRKFRSCVQYKEILEHVSPELGYLCLRKIPSPLSKKSMNQNNIYTKVGQPSRFYFPGLGRVSPTEIRYTKIAQDLKYYFGELDGFSISEIGIGFGGQCGQLVQLANLKSYELVDLSPVLALAQKYLKRIGVDGNILYNTNLEFSQSKPDLVISNYAFSELGREVQEKYFTELISKSPRGYVIYNHITPKNFNTMTAVEFASRITGAKLLEEYPLSHEGNKVVIWGVAN